MSRKIIWTLDRALSLIRELQPECEANGYYIALAGGVLNNGESYNDLDLVLVPKTRESDPATMIKWLTVWFGEPVIDSVPHATHLSFAHHCIEVALICPQQSAS